MRENKGIIVLLVLAVAAWYVYNSGGLGGLGGPANTDDMHATAAVILGAGTIDDGSSPTPGPSPNPNVKPNRKDCTVCKGTGFVKQGDGHVTECTACVPDSNAHDLLQEFIDQKVNSIAGEKRAASEVDRVQFVVDSVLEDAAAQYKKGNFAWAARYIGNAERILGRQKHIFGDSGPMYDKIKIAKDKLKARGFEVVPVYVIEKDVYDKFVEEWKVYTEKHKNCVQKRSEEEYNSGDSCSLNGDCSSGACCTFSWDGRTYMSGRGRMREQRACSSCGD